jgi:hypothetical protein
MVIFERERDSQKTDSTDTFQIWIRAKLTESQLLLEITRDVSRVVLLVGLLSGFLVALQEDFFVGGGNSGARVGQRGRVDENWRLRNSNFDLLPFRGRSFLETLLIEI